MRVFVLHRQIRKELCSSCCGSARAREQFIKWSSRALPFEHAPSSLSARSKRAGGLISPIRPKAHAAHSESGENLLSYVLVAKYLLLEATRWKGGMRAYVKAARTWQYIWHRPAALVFIRVRDALSRCQMMLEDIIFCWWREVRTSGFLLNWLIKIHRRFVEGNVLFTYLSHDDAFKYIYIYEWVIYGFNFDSLPHQPEPSKRFKAGYANFHDSAPS